MVASEPKHLSVDILHRLMRIFMEHKTDVLPVVERGRVIGRLDRLAIMEALSEIRPEGYNLTIKPAESVDEILKRMDDTASSGVATITQNFEFNAIWGRAEILQAQGKIPQVKVWSPSAQPPLDTSPQAIGLPAASNENQNDIDLISIQRTARVSPKSLPLVPDAPAKTEAEKPEPIAAKVEIRPVAEALHRDIERGRLAINTLAALDVPLMACDGSGSELFHNRAYADIRLRESIYLKSDDLVVRAKDAFTESAMSGDLDIDKAIVLKSAPRGFTLYCKAIRDFENPAARAVGYIFWLLATSPQPAGLVAHDLSHGQRGIEASYSGKTLPDILADEEARAMAWAMREANDNQSDAALLLGIPRQTFNYRYRRLTRRHGAARLKH